MRAAGSAATIWSRCRGSTSIAELNELLTAADARGRCTAGSSNRTLTVGEDFALERHLLRPLPSEVFETWLTLTPRVDRYARVTVRQCYYSVPAQLIGRRVRVRLGASQLVVFDGRTRSLGMSG